MERKDEEWKKHEFIANISQEILTEYFCSCSILATFHLYLHYQSRNSVRDKRIHRSSLQQRLK